MRFGPFEIMILLAIFFLLFGAERLPKLARAAGQSKGEFQKGLNEVTGAPSSATRSGLRCWRKDRSSRPSTEGRSGWSDPPARLPKKCLKKLQKPKSDSCSSGFPLFLLQCSAQMKKFSVCSKKNSHLARLTFMTEPQTSHSCST